MSRVSPTLEELQAQILVAPVTDFEPHIQKGICIKLSDSLSLAETALLIAADEKELIAKLIDEHKLIKATVHDYQIWRDQKVFFEFIIVQPFVLIKTLINLKPSID